MARARQNSLLRSAALVLLTLPLAIPLLRPGWFPSHEGLSYPIRLMEVARCWADGYYSARWFPDLNNGQGYPFLSFYAPLLFYLAGLFHSLGASLELSLKLCVILGAVLGAAGAYRIARLATSAPGAIVAAALYTYAPYHVRDVFMRGALAEYMALGFLPWSLFAVLRLRTKRRARDILFVAVAGGLPILTHNILGLFAGGMMLITAGLVVWGSRERTSTALAALAGGAGALLLTLFFWLPALYERRWVQIESMVEGYYDVMRHFIGVLDLVGPGEAPGLGQDLPMTFELGYPALLMLAFAPLALWRLRRAAARTRIALAAATACVLVGLLLSTALGTPVYRALPLLRFVQFPWRFLAVLTLGTALLGGIGFGFFLDRFSSRTRAIGTLAAIALAIAMVIPILGPKPNAPIPSWAIDPDHLSTVRLTASGVEYLPIWMTERQTPRGYESGVKILGQGAVEAVDRRTGRYDFVLDATDSVTVVLRDVYYPGWSGTADGAPLELQPRAGSGNIEFRMPPGRHEIRVRLDPSPLRRASQWISLAALLAGILFVAGASLRRARK
jgi:hypothetical protein